MPRFGDDRHLLGANVGFAGIYGVLGRVSGDRRSLRDYRRDAETLRFRKSHEARDYAAVRSKFKFDFNGFEAWTPELLCAASASLRLGGNP